MTRNILKIIVSLGLLAFLAARLDWRDVFERAAELEWWTLPLAVAIQVLISAIMNTRWWLLIRVHALGHSYRDLLGPTFIGTFFNNLLPSSTGGDLFRMYHIYRQGHGAAVAVSPIVTERAVGLLCMLALATVSMFQFSHDTPLFNTLRTLLLSLLCAGIAGITVVSVTATYRVLRKILARWDRFRPVSTLLHIIEAIHEYLNRRLLLSLLILISLGLQGLGIVVFLTLGSGVGASLPRTQYLFIVPVVFAAASIPVTVGGLGVREATAITLFSSAGMTQENAAVVSLLYIPVLLISALPGLWFFLRMKGHRRYYDRATHTDFSEPTRKSVRPR